MTASSHNQYAAPLLFMAAALFIFLCPLFWISIQAPGGGAVSADGENVTLYRQIFPSMMYGTESLRTGRLPLWNNRILCGTPYFSEGRHGLLQPLVIPFLFLAFPQALALHAFTALSAMAFFFVLFARSLGLRFVPSLLGALVAVCGGTSAAVMSNPLTLQTMMWFPLLLWVLREHLRQPRRETLVLGAMTLSLLLLGGAMLPALVLALTAVLYGALCVYRGVAPSEDSKERNQRWKRALSLGSLIVLGLLLFSVQGFPMLARLRLLESSLQLLDNFRIAASLPAGVTGLWAQMLDLQTQLLPAPGRVGIMTLLLLPAAFLHPLPRWERIFFGLSIPGFVVLSVFTGEAQWVQALYLPVSFFIALLAALGLDRLFTVRRDAMTPRLWMPVIASLSLFILLFLFAPDSARGRMLPFIPALAFFLIFRRQWASVLACIFILVFLYVDLASSFANRQDHPFFQSTPELRVDRQLTNRLRESALDGRVLLLADRESRSFHPNLCMTTPLHGVLGEGSLLSQSQSLWRDQWEQRCERGDAPAFLSMLRLMSVQVIATDKSFGGLDASFFQGMNLQQQNREGRISLHTTPQGLARAYWVPRWRLATDDQAALDGICDPAFDPTRECLVTSDKKTVHHLARIVADTSEAAQELAAPRIVVTEHRPEEITVHVETPGPGILVFSESFEEGWQAVDNDQAHPLLHVNGIFMGVALDKGSHHIRFLYRPPFLVTGGIVSALTVLFCLMLLLAAPLQKRLRPSPAAPQDTLE